MGVYPHIACCVEDSPGSRIALAEARRLRRLAPGRLSVVHVVGMPAPPPYLGEGGSFIPEPAAMLDGALSWLRDQLPGDPPAEPVVLEGHAGQAVCAWAADSAVDLLVAGAERGAVERLLLGSFAGHLSRHAPCSVLLVRPGRPGVLVGPGDR